MTEGTGHEGHTIFWNLGGGEAEQQVSGMVPPSSKIALMWHSQNDRWTPYSNPVPFALPFSSFRRK